MIILRLVFNLILREQMAGGCAALWIYAGGSERPIDEEVLKEKLHYVQMSGSDVFKFAIQAISESANKVLEQEGLVDSIFV